MVGSIMAADPSATRFGDGAPTSAAKTTAIAMEAAESSGCGVLEVADADADADAEPSPAAPASAVGATQGGPRQQRRPAGTSGPIAEIVSDAPGDAYLLAATSKSESPRPACAAERIPAPPASCTVDAHAAVTIPVSWLVDI